MVRGPEGPPAKQAKTESIALPANVIVQFQNDADEIMGEADHGDYECNQADHNFWQAVYNVGAYIRMASEKDHQKYFWQFKRLYLLRVTGDGLRTQGNESF